MLEISRMFHVMVLCHDRSFGGISLNDFHFEQETLEIIFVIATGKFANQNRMGKIS